MTQEVKEAYRKVEEYESNKRKQENLMDYRMYRDAGCHECNRGQITRGGGDYTSVTYWSRCECSKKPSDRYKDFLKHRDELMYTMSAISFKNLEDKWVDNYSRIEEGSNETDRSW